MPKIFSNHIKSCVILALFLIQNIYSQTYPNWSKSFDYLGYGYVKATCKTQSGNLFLAKNNDITNVYFPPEILLFDKTTTQLINHNGNGFGLEHITDMKLMGDSVLFIAGLASNTSNTNKIFKKNISSSNWQQICQSDHNINCLEIYNNKLYIGGKFSTLNGVSYRSLASYNPNTNTLDSIPGTLYYGGFFYPPIVNCLKRNNLGLVVGGQFINAGSTVLNSIGLYNNTGWHSLNNGLKLASGTGTFIPTGKITSMTVDPLDSNSITVGGNFNYFNNHDYQYYYFGDGDIISKWNNSLNKWDTIRHFRDAQDYQYHTTGPKYLSDLKYYNNELYLAYSYPTNGARILKLNSSNWTILPLKFRDDVKEGCSLDVFDGDLLISSYQTYPINGTVRYNSNGTFRSFGLGMNLHGLYAKEGNEVFICNGGNTSYTHVCSGSNMSSIQIIKYDLATMKYDSIQSALSNMNVSGSLIRGLYSKGDSLIALGYFSSNNFTPGVSLNAGAIYRKSTKQWLPLINSAYTTSVTGSGNARYFKAIAHYGNGFFIGGNFIINNNQNLQNLVYWNGTSFDSLKLMPHTGYINCLEITNDTLWVGGKFSGNQLRNFAAYKISTKQWVPTASFYDYGINDAEINKITVYKNKIFIVGNNIYRYAPSGWATWTNLPDTAGSAGYLLRNNLNSFYPFTKFKKNSFPDFENQYIQNDSIVYLMGYHMYKSTRCNNGISNCDSTGGILEYNYISNKFKGYFESGVRPHEFYQLVSFMTEYNNQHILFGNFESVGYNTGSAYIAALSVGPSIITSDDKNIENNDTETIKIYPNPSNGIFEIKTKNQIKYIEIFDFTGKLVARSFNTVIDLKNSASGIYLAKIIDSQNKTYTKKIILNN